ncbi:type II toxin-antitoxin system RelE/ParE family toxin [Candidatus Woesearchaeota archaeon]|nr:type II toxin-antitoxin system RelE/ParE family toxin [Candidatus Woesearchaeota archaeon]
MAYTIVWSDSALKQLKKLEQGIAKRIYEKVGELSGNPLRNTTKLVGEPGYRLRVGDYRVVFDIKHKELQVLVLKVGHRHNIY